MLSAPLIRQPDIGALYIPGFDWNFRSCEIVRDIEVILEMEYRRLQLLILIAKPLIVAFIETGQLIEMIR